MRQMKMTRWLWSGIRSLLVALLLLVLLAALFAAWRLLSFGQRDDATAIEGKRAYLAQVAAGGGVPPDSPNIVFILYDDMGYGDIGAGAIDNSSISTPTIDRLAAAGVTLSDFHSPAPVCTPSRAGFLTGRLPVRAGLPYVVFPSGSASEFFASIIANPDANVRLPEEEITLADVLQAAGYATGMVGKWHLGDRSPSLPNDMGFEYFFGALYSNDMTPFALYRNREIAVPAPMDQRQLSETYAREAVDFIDAHAGERFFLYLAHNFPHDPLSVSPERLGRSSGGLYGDVLAELDEGVGRIVGALESHGLLDNTLIVISSDNGPWFLGGAGDQRGRKGSTFEGGMRVPFIAHWPREIPGGRIEDAMAMGTDLLPTVLDILGMPAPGDRELDGRSLLGLLRAGGASPHDVLYYYDGIRLFAVRDQRFKYRAPAGVFYSTDSTPVALSVPQKEWLFDLARDPSESYDTADRHPEVLQRLQQAFADKQREMQANPRGWRSR